MKISGFEIDRFGVWRNFAQKLRPNGLNVFYGPNEAGKTTLLRFFRGVLYGYHPDEGPTARRGAKSSPKSGLLNVVHRDLDYEVRRVSRGEDGGLLTVSGVASGDSSARLLSELVAGTDEKLFESVFAVGLPELQEFATLTDDEVARHLYGMTLGPQGQLLMDLPRKMDAELDRMWPKDGHRGKFGELAEKHRDLTQQMQGLRPQRERYRTLVRQRRELEQRINSLRKKHTDLQAQLRGHQYLEKVHAPWSRVRDQKRELAGIPDLRSFPTDGLSRLARLEADRDATVASRDELLTELKLINKNLQANRPDDGIRRFAGSIRALQEQRAQWDDLHQRMVTLENQAAEHDRELNRQVLDIGKGWTLARLETIVDTPEAHGRFVAAAREYQSIRSKTKRRQKWYRKVSASCRDRELALRTELMHLGVEAPTLQEPLDLAKQRLVQLTELGQLQLQAAELRQRSLTIDDHMQRLQDRMGLPDWVWLILAFFVLAGIGLFAAGLSAGISTGWLVGAIYVVLALTAGGTTWALKLEFEAEIQRQVAELREQRNSQDTRRHAIEQRIIELVQQHGLWDPDAERAAPIDATDGKWVALSAERLARLELAQREYQKILDTRQRLSQMRGRLQCQQRGLGTSRRTWCETLKSLGYDEVVDVNAAFAQWQQVTAARELRRRSQEARREIRGLREDWERFRTRVEDLGRRMRSDKLDFTRPFLALDQWDGELRTWITSRQEYRRLLKDRKTRRAEADEIQRRVDHLQHEIATLLQQANATDRTDLERKLQLYQRRQQIELALQQATRDLELITQSEPQLALVEDDLVRFRPTENTETIKRLTREAADAEKHLQEQFEQLGTVKQELKSLSADRQSSRVRFEQAQAHEQMLEAWTNWYATAASAESVDLVSAMFEQAHQPEMLAAAIPFVERLTCNKYHRLWTQLGRRQLFVDDQLGSPRPAEQLSGGTREQLFLAIRLAMVKAFASHGIELPMVLDDVTVNFDVERSEAAVETLMEFAKDGQQVLVFTSHIHFAQMFQKRGIEPIWLPARDRNGQILEDRLAG